MKKLIALMLLASFTGAVFAQQAAPAQNKTAPTGKDAGKDKKKHHHHHHDHNKASDKK